MVIIVQPINCNNFTWDRIVNPINSKKTEIAYWYRLLSHMRGSPVGGSELCEFV